VPALTPDYDTDPERSRSFRVSWQEDVHAPVAERLISAREQPVLDVGCGIGRFGAALPYGLDWIGLDESPRQLAGCARRPVVRADACRLPCTGGSVGAVTMLWMLYHLDDPRLALAEARRVLRPGGLLVACASSRSNDPELVPDGYPRTTFDAEEAADITAEVFGAEQVEVERWDAPLVRLHDRDEVAAYAHSHLLPATIVDTVEPPLTLTKRGCLVWARRP
jgi:SAM-dependent methyltransferase